MNYGKIFKFVAVVVFLVGVAAVAVSYNKMAAKTKGSDKPSPSVKAVYSQTYTPAGGSSVLQARMERWQKADGSWKETTTNYGKDGSVIDTRDKYAVNGRGLFAVSEKEKQLQYLGQRPEVVPAFSEEGFRKGPNFAGEGSLLGFRTLIERIKEDGGDSTEFHRVPELNGLIVKIVSTSADGAKTVIEATDLKITEFSDSEYGVIPDYPIAYDSYEKAISSTKNNGNPEAAKEMEKNIPK